MTSPAGDPVPILPTGQSMAARKCKAAVLMLGNDEPR